MEIYEDNLFEKIFGFKEKSTKEENLKNIRMNQNIMITPTKSYNIGHFIELGLFFLKKDIDLSNSIIKVKYNNIENAGDVCNYIAQNPHGLYQVASQFNYLEMPYPGITPSHGVSNYPKDNTQGPAVAINTYPSTFYRNWILTEGDNKEEQLNGLKFVIKQLDLMSKEKELVRWENGYALAGKDLNENILQILNITQTDLDKIVEDNLNVGIVNNCDSVIQYRFNCNGPYYLTEDSKLTSTIFCSAIALSYSDRSIYLEPLAKSVLKATYKITVMAGVKLKLKNVYLTQIGGGVFGNKIEWIKEAIEEAIDLVKYHDITINSLFFKTVPNCFNSLES
ncbi:hypothetical protein CPAV1605_701 [seawater metagenome]|uniref:Uncharacterized protein n=1 Tax=seawater metagenome TaxID=1561972 RepID=A0A5E8CIQ9_9ZZZZ